MKHLIYILFFLTSTQAHSQESEKYLTDYNEAKKKYFKYNAQQLELIKANWGMYFKENLMPVLDTSIKEPVFEIKLDSYGCIYPDIAIQNTIGKSQFEGPIEDFVDIESHSFHRLFREDEDSKILQAVNTLTNNSEKQIYTDLLKLSKLRDLDSEDSYYAKWNTFHLEKLKNSLNGIIASKQINRVIFYIHGYNVPYSLAVIQAITILKETRKVIGKEIKNVLFVPVYWPSNNAKQDLLEQDNFDISNIADKKRNGDLFLTYSTRCYYAAITLRQILNAIENTSVKIDIFSHSLGATIATSALINTFTKLDYATTSLFEERNSFCKLSSNEKLKYRNNDYYCYDLMNNFCDSPIPTRNVNVFLSAAAIPGVSTFTDAIGVSAGDFKYFVTVNQYDEMLTKDNIRKEVKKKIKLNLGFIKASKLSSTTLGCNYHGETFDTKKLFEDKIKKDRFFWETISNEIDHDIFTYLNQDAYLQFYKRFLLAN